MANLTSALGLFLTHTIGKHLLFKNYIIHLFYYVGVKGVAHATASGGRSEKNMGELKISFQYVGPGD